MKKPETEIELLKQLLIKVEPSEYVDIKRVLNYIEYLENNQVITEEDGPVRSI